MEGKKGNDRDVRTKSEKTRYTHGNRSRMEPTAEVLSVSKTSSRRHIAMHSRSAYVLRPGLAIIRQQPGNQLLRPKKSLTFDDKRHIVGTSIEKLYPGRLLLWFNARPEPASAFVISFDGLAILLFGEAVRSGCRTEEQIVGIVDGSFWWVKVW
jgi:hypothetical protein